MKLPGRGPLESGGQRPFKPVTLASHVTEQGLSPHTSVFVGKNKPQR